MTITAPVLFLVFNRPQTTAQVMEAIRAARPPRLYVAADGPRNDRSEEAEQCRLARQMATAVQWARPPDCDRGRLALPIAHAASRSEFWLPHSREFGY